MPAIARASLSRSSASNLPRAVADPSFEGRPGRPGAGDLLKDMTAATSHRGVLIGASLLTFGLVFAGFLTLETPGLGLANFYYFAVALVALALGPYFGARRGRRCGGSLRARNRPERQSADGRGSRPERLDPASHLRGHRLPDRVLRAAKPGARRPAPAPRRARRSHRAPEYPRFRGRHEPAAHGRPIVRTPPRRHGWAEAHQRQPWSCGRERYPPASRGRARSGSSRRRRGGAGRRR